MWFKFRHRSQCMNIEVTSVIFLLFIPISLSTNSKKVYRFLTKQILDNDWLRIILNQTANEDTMIWTFDSKQLKPDLIDKIIKCYSSNMPTIRFDASKLGKNPDLWKKIYNYQRSTKMIHVIILKETQFFIRECCYVVATIRELSGILPLPKVIIFIYGTKSFPSLHSLMKKQLLITWEDKYLDLTMIYIHPKPKSWPIYMYYLPFEKAYYNESLKRNSTLYPDKLKDMKGYEFKIADENSRHQNMIEYEESLRYRRDFLMSMNPGQYIFIKYMFCKTHNCTAVNVKFNRDRDPNIYYYFYFFNEIGYKQSTFGVVYEWYYIGAGVPQLKGKNISLFAINNFENYTMYWFLICLLVLLKAFIKILNLDGRNWTIFPVFFCVIGMPMRIGNTFKERFCYILLIIISLYVSQDLLNFATNDELETIRISVNTYQDLDSLDVPIYSVHGNLYEFIDANDSANVKEKTKIVNFVGIWECVEQLAERDDRICVDNVENIHMTSSKMKTKERGKNSSNGIRRANFNLMVSTKAQQLEKASPFLEIFNRAVLRSLDHGLIDRSNSKKYHNAYNYDYDEEDYDEIHIETFDLSFRLLFVIILMHIFATCVFVIEKFTREVEKYTIEEFSTFA